MGHACVFDANFFISIRQVTDDPVVESVALTLKNLGEVAWTSDRILDEIASIRQSDKRLVTEVVRRTFRVEMIPEAEILALEGRIGKTKSPQHSDLSLMVLGERLGDGGGCTLVSDDFKIHETQLVHNLRFKVVSPSAFFLSLSNRTTDQGRRGVFRRLYREIRRRELEYAISRRDTYNVEPKIAWLMDNLLSSVPQESQTTRVVQVTEGLEVDMAPLLRHIEGEKVRGSKLKDFEAILPFVDVLKGCRATNAEVTACIEGGDLESALRVVRTSASMMRRRLQVAAADLDFVNGMKLRQVYAHYLAHDEFLLAILHLSMGDLETAEERLDDSAFLALMTGDTQDIVKASYLKGFLFLSADDYKEARNQFEASARLAGRYAEERTRLQCLLGAAMAALLSGAGEDAHRMVTEANRSVHELGREAADVLILLADHLFHFGKAEMALAIYNEALESAIEWREQERIPGIAERIRRTHAILAGMGTETGPGDVDVPALVDRVHELSSEAQSAYFHAVQEITTMEAEVLKPLPESLTVTDWRRGRDLPKQFQGWHDVMRRVPLAGESGPDGKGDAGCLLITYLEGVGTIGYYTAKDLGQDKLGQYRFQFREDGEFKILDAIPKFRRRFGLRALIGARDHGHVELRRGYLDPVGDPAAPPGARPASPPGG